MRKSLRALLCASAFLCCATLAHAGAVGDYSRAHLTTIDLFQTSVGTGVKAQRIFPLPVSTGQTKSAAAMYDTLSATDTLSVINMSDNFNMNEFMVAGTKGSTVPDSIFLGRLTINAKPDSFVFATTDSFFVFVDASPDGSNFWSQARQATDGISGGIVVPTGNRERSCTIVKDIWTRLPLTAFAVPTAGTTPLAIAGAKAIRFRIQLGRAAVAKRCSATWTYPSGSPDKEK